LSAGDWDELDARAKKSAESGGVPEHWGVRADVEVGEQARGRHRGHEEGGKSGAYLLWIDGDERYIWGCTSLDREYDREKPNIGDDVVIAREANYRTQYDGPNDEPTGKSYGVATRENKSPLPGSSASSTPADDASRSRRRSERCRTFAPTSCSCAPREQLTTSG
jgi:hypothetical protein